MKTGIEWVADFEKTFPLPADRRIVVRVLVDAAIAEAEERGRRAGIEECIGVADSEAQHCVRVRDDADTNTIDHIAANSAARAARSIAGRLRAIAKPDHIVDANKMVAPIEPKPEAANECVKCVDGLMGPHPWHTTAECECRCYHGGSDGDCPYHEDTLDAASSLLVAERLMNPLPATDAIKRAMQRSQPLPTDEALAAMTKEIAEWKLVVKKALGRVGDERDDLARQLDDERKHTRAYALDERDEARDRSSAAEANAQRVREALQVIEAMPTAHAAWETTRDMHFIARAALASPPQAATGGSEAQKAIEAWRALTPQDRDFVDWALLEAGAGHYEVARRVLRELAKPTEPRP